MINNTQKSFLELVKDGLWGNGNPIIRIDETTDWQEVYQLATEQSVLGLVLGGLEHSNVKPPQPLLLQWIGEVQMIEHRNRAINLFVAELVEKMRFADIYTTLIKGQGVAQCYKKPLWRSAGDVDFCLNEENFVKAREFLRPLAVNGYDPNDDNSRNISAKVGNWDIELHANQFTGLSRRVDNGIKTVLNDVLNKGHIRCWMNGNTQVLLPNADCDALLIFTHFLKHFYKGGIGLRQICDWCRLLWTFKNTINHKYLESMILKMGLMEEWKAFGAFAVDFLGMPSDAIPFYSSSNRWSRKAVKICSFVMKVGNMGHNRSNSIQGGCFIIRKINAFICRCDDLVNHATIFPMASIKYFPSILFNGIIGAVKGVG